MTLRQPTVLQIRERAIKRLRRDGYGGTIHAVELDAAIAEAREAYGCGHNADPTYNGMWCSFCNPDIGGDRNAQV